MKTLRMILGCLGMLAVFAAPAFAVDTSVTYKSGILVLVFLGVCALIVVAQLVPALILMIGFFKAVVTGLTRKKAVAVQSTQK